MPFPPNPVILPAYADPIAWLVAMVCLALEAEMLRWAFVRRGAPGKTVHDRLVLLNLASWGALLAAVHGVAAAGRWGERQWSCLAELGVVVVAAEAVALRWAVVPLTTTGARPGWPWVLGWSCAANLTAAAASGVAIAAGAAWMS